MGGYSELRSGRHERTSCLNEIHLTGTLPTPGVSQHHSSIAQLNSVVSLAKVEAACTACGFKLHLRHMILALPRLECAQLELSPGQRVAPMYSLPRGSPPPADS